MRDRHHTGEHKALRFRDEPTLRRAVRTACGLEELGTRVRPPLETLGGATRFGLLDRCGGSWFLAPFRGSSTRGRARWTARCGLREENGRPVVVTHPTVVPPAEMHAVEPVDGVAVEVGERFAAKRPDGAPVLTVGDRPATDIVERHFDRSHGAPGGASQPRGLLRVSSSASAIRSLAGQRVPPIDEDTLDLSSRGPAGAQDSRTRVPVHTRRRCVDRVGGPHVSSAIAEPSHGPAPLLSG
jgi:hypothetical protein